MELAVQLREYTGKKTKLLRRESKVPGIVYGKYIDAPVNLVFDKQEFLKLYKSAGYSMPFTLKGEGLDQLVLIHDIQVDPVTDYVLHVDFLTLKKGQKVTTDVQIMLEGVAPIEKLGLGKVQLVKDVVTIEALPKDLVHDIKLDISGLETTHDVVFVKDLIVGKGVEIVDDLELPIVIVAALSADVEEDEVEEVAETTTEASAQEDSEKTAE